MKNKIIVEKILKYIKKVKYRKRNLRRICL